MPLPVLCLSILGPPSWLGAGCRKFPEIRHVSVKVPEVARGAPFMRARSTSCEQHGVRPPLVGIEVGVGCQPGRQRVPLGG